MISLHYVHGHRIRYRVLYVILRTRYRNDIIEQGRLLPALDKDSADVLVATGREHIVNAHAEKHLLTGTAVLDLIYDVLKNPELNPHLVLRLFGAGIRQPGHWQNRPPSRNEWHCICI
jgi:hypothetical protein